MPNKSVKEIKSTKEPFHPHQPHPPKNHTQCRRKKSKRSKSTFSQKRKKKYSKSNQERHDDEKVNNDDVIEQLQRQREKERIRMEEIQSFEENSGQPHDQSLTQNLSKKITPSENENLKQKFNLKAKAELPKVMGNYKYDPIRKAYFPIQSFDQISSSKVLSKQKSKEKNLNVKSIRPNSLESIVSVLNAVSICPHTWKRKYETLQVMEKLFVRRSKFQPTTISMNKIEYDVRRNEQIWRDNEEEFMEKESFVRKTSSDMNVESNVVQTLPSSSGVQNDNVQVTNRNTIILKNSLHSLRNYWISMLSPMGDTFKQSKARSNNVPLDCKSTTTLHPTSRTFAILASLDPTYLPHIATTVSEKPDTKSPSVYFRPATFPRPYFLDKNGIVDCGPRIQSRNNNRSSHPNFLCLSQSNLDGSYQAIRMTSNANGMNDIFLGSLSYNAQSRLQTFRMSNLLLNDGLGEANCFGIMMPSQLNDFAFSTCGGIRKVAFAPITSSKPSHDSSPMILDVPTLTLHSALANHGRPEPQETHHSFRSDSFCVEYFGQSIFYGQRNGCIQVIDERSGTITHSLNSKVLGTRNRKNNSKHQPVAFGSVSSIAALNTEGSKNGSCPISIVVGGSFGSCRLFDLRRTKPNDSLIKMKIPSDQGINHCASTRCTGVAISPDEKICISPYISSNNCIGHSTHLGMWSLISGHYIGSIDVGTTKIIGNSNNPRSDNNQNPLYCELSGTVTRAWGIKHRYCRSLRRKDLESAVSLYEKQKSWGLWLKCGGINFGREHQGLPYYPPIETGGIHHVTFPGFSDVIV